MILSRCSKVITEAETEIPRSFSIFMKSDVVRRCSPRARTAPAIRIAPPVSSRFSVKVVLPASGWEIIAKVLLRADCRANSFIWFAFEKWAFIQKLPKVKCSATKRQIYRSLLPFYNWIMIFKCYADSQ